MERCSARLLRRLACVVLLLLTASAVSTAVPLRSAEAATFSDVVLAEAARHQGKPYRFGATGPDAFDCSGFTGYVYGRLGVPLPRTAAQQYAALPKVAQADKRPGDLVFTYDSSGIYHVGIYAGGNVMWAAPKAGDVVRLQTIWTASYKVARPVTGAITQHWISLGGRTGFLGAPTTGELTTPDRSGSFTHFQGGSIYRSAAGTREVHGSIRSTWARLGWEQSALGYPVTDEQVTPDRAGRYNHFQRGSVYWTPSTGAREVRGAIRDTWSRLGWERGAVGYPVSDEMVTPDRAGRYNHFQRGSIYWTPTTGAKQVQGAIRDTWSRLGWERGAGYPLTDELRAPDGRGRYNDFQRGSVYWTSTTGARLLGTELRDHWRRVGAGQSPLGYPTSDERVTPDRTRRSAQFERGALHWSATTGFAMVTGSVHTAWKAAGAESSALGLPVRGNYAVDGGEAADFEGGTLRWDAATASATVLPLATAVGGG